MGVSMLREGLSVALALLLASSSVLPTVQGCSEIFLGNTSVYDAVVSARNLDFFDSIDYSMVAVPRGTRAQYAPYSGCTPSPFNGPVKIGYVGNVADTSLAANYFNATCRGNNWANYAGVVLDGLNEAGLSCGMLTDQGSFLPSSNITGTTPALYFYDLCAYILSTFRTAAEVRQFFSSQRIQVVNNIMIFNALNSLSPIFGTRINHWSIHDAQSNSLLIEWVSESQYALRDNTAGVLTNSPNLPEQEAGYFEFRASQDAKFGAPAASIMTPGFCGVGWDSTTPENNNCNSMGRYTTLRQLKAAMYVPFVNAGVPMNPGYNPNPAHQAYSQAVLFLNWVTIPGSWPTYQTNITGPTEMTIVTYIRDHRNLKYIFRASTTMQWGEFDLRSLFSANGVYTRATRRLTLQPLQVLLPATQSFAINFNDALLPK